MINYNLRKRYTNRINDAIVIFVKQSKTKNEGDLKVYGSKDQNEHQFFFYSLNVQVTN